MDDPARSARCRAQEMLGKVLGIVVIGPDAVVSPSFQVKRFDLPSSDGSDISVITARISIALSPAIPNLGARLFVPEEFHDLILGQEGSP